MRRRLLLISIAVLVLAAPASAQQRTLWPGVTFDTGVQFTPNGPVAINILTGPRPGGATTVAPVLSNETLTGTETLTAMQRRTTTSSTSAGVNGDFFTFSSGLPSGVLMREGQMASPPSDERSSAGVLTDGTLDVRRVSFVGTWQGAGNRRTLTKFNRPFPGTGIVLYTDSWGPTTPDGRRRDGRGPVPLPGRDPEHGPRRAGRRAADRRRRRPDPARWSRPAREGRCGVGAERGGACDPARDAAAPLQAGLAERRRCDRRRAADRA